MVLKDTYKVSKIFSVYSQMALFNLYEFFQRFKIVKVIEINYLIKRTVHFVIFNIFYIKKNSSTVQVNTI